MQPHWLNTSEYPFKPNYFHVHGAKMHYIDEGVGEVILFVHGTPSWSFDFRNQVKTLSKNYRCIAVDHIGFGLSDKPEGYNYSTQNHGKSLELLVLHLSLTEFTVVVHDFGGPIGLAMAIKYPSKVKSLVVLNTWLWNAGQSPSFRKLRPVLKSPLLPFLYKYLNFSPKFLLPGSFGKKKLVKHLRGQFLGPFIKRSERLGPIAFAHSLLHDQSWFESLWANREAIQSKPTLLIWGLLDTFVTPDFLGKFKQNFLSSRIVELKSCGHFPQEEEPETVSEAIASFLKTR